MAHAHLHTNKHSVQSRPENNQPTALQIFLQMKHNMRPVAWDIWKHRNSYVFKGANRIEVILIEVANECALWCAAGASDLEQLLLQELTQGGLGLAVRMGIWEFPYRHETQDSDAGKISQNRTIYTLIHTKRLLYSWDNSSRRFLFCSKCASASLQSSTCSAVSSGRGGGSAAASKGSNAGAREEDPSSGEGDRREAVAAALTFSRRPLPPPPPAALPPREATAFPVAAPEASQRQRLQRDAVARRIGGVAVGRGVAIWTWIK
ncbi:hypothetical protein U9M48_035114 [Paspalum notatum var. saurae]|uniref:Uncharacterized protein n=1 Tax=Paspalum notatum var. saurae TaxID=547442 RepID=A0AAQ3UFN3_PASNO